MCAVRWPSQAGAITSVCQVHFAADDYRRSAGRLVVDASRCARFLASMLLRSCSVASMRYQITPKTMSPMSPPRTSGGGHRGIQRG